MFDIDSKHGTVRVFAETIEEEAVGQITQMANSPLGEGANIRIMPDAHAGKGCTIGTTMFVTDKVCPNLVGVDIGCGVMVARMNVDFKAHLGELDQLIRERIPSGFSVHAEPSSFVSTWLPDVLLCWNKLPETARDRITRSMGTLGGGNHFIEAYEDGYVSVHTGSRNLGVQVCKYYQQLAERQTKDRCHVSREQLETVPPECREAFIKDRAAQRPPRDLEYLTGALRDAYLHDMKVCQMYAQYNRGAIIYAIRDFFGRSMLDCFDTMHNYISHDEGFWRTRIRDGMPKRFNVLRKGAIAAHWDQRVAIPLNMRDGLLICRGKENTDWNCSAPHGAGRLYSRSAAKAKFTVYEYREAMGGIYTTCVNESTLDEAPFAYKDMDEIMRCIEPTVDVETRLKPIYNFKAN